MKMNMVRGMRLLLILMSVSLIVGVVSAQTADEIYDDELGVAQSDTMAKLGAGIALAGCGIGTGLSQGPVGAAGVGMVAEDGSKFVTALIFMAIPETIVLFGFVALFLL
jgi:V/A-type H+-transporting ATPase subunit K